MKTPQLPEESQSAPNKRDSINLPCRIGRFPVRQNTVIAEVLARLVGGDNLTGMDAVFRASTTRLAAVVFSLEQCHGWTIERVDLNVGTKDGRVALVKTYYLSRTAIRQAFDAGALEYCKSVKAARAKRRERAPKARAEADKRNAARAAARFDPNQGQLFGGEHAWPQ